MDNHNKLSENFVNNNSYDCVDNRAIFVNFSAGDRYIRNISTIKRFVTDRLSLQTGSFGVQ